MTWIVDDNGRRWVEPVERKRRAHPKAKRFAHVKAGDWLEGGAWEAFAKRDAGDRKVPPVYSLVTDMWILFESPTQNAPLRGGAFSGLILGYCP